VSSSHGAEDNRQQPAPKNADRDGAGLRLRPAEVATVVTVIALILAACWPAFGVLFAGHAGKAIVPAEAAPNSAAPAAPGLGAPLVPTSNAGPVTLTLLAPKYGPNIDHAFWDAVTATFHAANPDITVNVEQVDRSDLVSEADAKLPAPDAPDAILGVFPDDVRSAALGGRLYTSDDIVPPTDELLPCFNYREQTMGPDGYPEQFGIPFSATTLELYYNKRLFSQAHITAPPATWDDVSADAAKIKALGKTGYGLAMGAPDVDAIAQLWMAGNDGGFTDAAKSRWTVNLPGNVDTFRWLNDSLVRPGRTEAHPGTKSTHDLEKDFAAGNLGMLVADRDLIAQTEAGALGTAFGVTQIPGRFRPMMSSLGFVDDLLATKAHPDHKIAIGKFVSFLLTPKYQKQFADLDRRLPVTRAGAAAEGPDPLLKPFLDGMTVSDWLPYRDPAWPVVEQSIRSDLASALTGDPQVVLDRVQAVATSAR
jgi:multiple sugar transport system substrate-binding protein